MKLKELLEKRKGIVDEVRKLDSTLEKEKRSMTADEKTKWEDWNKDIDSLTDDIRRQERMADLEKLDGSSRREFRNDDTPGDQRGGEDPREAEKRALDRMARANGDIESLSKDDRESFLNLQRKAFRSFIREGRHGVDELEKRALSQNISADGGYLVAPVQWMGDLIQQVDDMVFIRQLATKHQLTTAHSLGVPTLDTDPADADWTTELGTGSEDSTMKFGKRELSPHPLAKRIKISKKLLRSSPTVENLVRDRLAYKFAITEEKAFLTGNGVQKPLGIFTASTDGISTSRDVSTGNTTTAIGADNLIECKYALKAQYMQSAHWIFHRDAVKAIRKLKDSQNQYLWQPSLVEGDPDRILDLPFHMSEYAPNTFTTGLYVGALGDFRQYWIADALNMELQRLSELYAESNQMGFIGRAETDGMPVLEEAFVRVTLA